MHGGLGEGVAISLSIIACGNDGEWGCTSLRAEASGGSNLRFNGIGG